MAAGYPYGRVLPRRAALAAAVGLAAVVLGGCAPPGLLWVPDRDLNADLRRLSQEMERTGDGPEAAARRQQGRA